MLKTVGFPSTRTGDQTILNGNLIIGTAGKGIDFSADPATAGMTSELLDDYEEGTWTPSGGNIGATSATKIGRQVTVNAVITGTSIAFGTTTIVCDNLPFSSSANSAGAIIDTGSTQGAFVRAAGTYIVTCSAMSIPVTSVAVTVTYNV